MIRFLIFVLLASCGRSPYAPESGQLVGSPTFLRFAARVGEVIEPQMVSLFEARTADLCWRASIPVTWVAISRTSGCGPAAVAVSVATRDIAPGTHQTSIQFLPTSPGTHLGTAVTVQLDLTAPGWTSLGGPWSGPITAVASDPSNADRVVAGGTNGRHLYTSNDGGRSFEPAPVDFGNNVAVSAIALTDTGRGYLTLEITGTGGGGGAWWSDDHGSTWRESTAGELDLLAMSVHPADPMVALAVGSAVYLTQDGGASWAQVHAGSSRTVVSDSDGFWLGGDDGCLYRSDDGTALTLTHTFLDVPGDPGSATIPVQQLATVAGDTLLAMTGGGNTRLWRSDDGTHWEPAPALGAPLSAADTSLFGGGSSLWALDQRVFVSTDVGETFTEVPIPVRAGLDGRRFRDLAPHLNGHLLAHDNLGVLRWESGTVTHAALTANNIRDIEFDPTTATLYMVGLFAGAFARDAIGFRGLGGSGLIAGQSWNISLDPRNGANIIVGGAIVREGVYRSTDFGDSWTRGVTGIPSTSGTCIYSLERAPEEPDVIWIAGCSGLYRSDDGGQSYARLDPDYEPGMVAAASADVAIYTRNGLRRYDTAVGAREILFSSPVPSFIGRTADGSLWWSADGHGLHRSRDQGVSFELVNADIVGVLDLVMSTDNHEHLFGATSSTMLESRDGGLHWDDAGSPFPPRSLLLDPESDTVWVGTDGGGSYTYLAP